MTQTKTKKALLMSVLSMVLCVAMLVGMTFAWFTDTASTGVNKIQAGNLKVELQMKDSTGNWVNVENQTLNFMRKDASGALVADANILWEPGCTYELPELRVVNKGNLALKFYLSVNGVDGNAKLLEAIEWKMSGTAYDGLYFPNLDAEVIKLLPGHSWGLKLSAHMKNEAGNEYQGLSIDGIGITVVATQDTVESDSISDQYDKDATYPNVVTLTPEMLTTQGAISFNQSDTVYYLDGNFGNFTITRENSTKNVSFIAKAGAKFTGDVTIQYHAGDRDSTLTENSSLTVKGIKTEGNLTVVSRDKNVIIEGNEAKQIKLQMKDIASNIQVLNNKMNGSSKYGFWLDPFVTDYELTMSGNTFESIQSHAIAIQGNGGTSAITAAKTIDIKGNYFNSYGLDNDEGRAAFKIWADTKYAPNDTDPLNEAAKELAKYIKDNNEFNDSLGSYCVLANFYGKYISFS